MVRCGYDAWSAAQVTQHFELTTGESDEEEMQLPVEHTHDQNGMPLTEVAC